MATRKKGRARSPLPGLLIAFEGGDGAGKSTQIRRLVGWLRREGHTVLVTRQPGGSPLGRRLRRLLLQPDATVSDRAELFMYEADRAQHVDEVVRPALARGTIVVSDRFADSSTVYQGYCRGLGREWTERLNDFATGGLEPDLVLLLDLPEAVGRGRVRSRKRPDRIESEARAFHRRVRRAFLEVAGRHRHRTVVVNAHQPVEKVAEQVRALVGKRLAGKRKGVRG